MKALLKLQTVAYSIRKYYSETKLEFYSGHTKVNHLKTDKPGDFPSVTSRDTFIGFLRFDQVSGSRSSITQIYYHLTGQLSTKLWLCL